MPQVQSVERAFAILGCLAGGPAGVSDIAARVGLAKSTASRLLATLADVGAVAPLADGSGYRIGDAMIEIAAGAVPGGNLVAIARPHLVELVATVGEDSGLSVLDGSDVYYLDQVSGDAHVQLRDWTGERVPAHCVPSGLVILSRLPARARSAAIPPVLERFAPRTITTGAELLARLAAVAKRDAEWVYGEFAEDINSVAAPVLDAAGHVTAAIHVHGPAYRFPGETDPAWIAEQVAVAAARVTNRLSGDEGAWTDAAAGSEGTSGRAR